MVTEAALREGCSMGELVVRAIQRGADRVAFVHGERSITYREFGSLLSRFVQALEAHGLRRGDAIATLSSNRPEAFLVTAAAYLTGMRVTWMHPMASEDDHAYQLEDSGVETLFVDPEAFSQRANALKLRLPRLARVFGFGPNRFGADILAELSRFEAGPLVPRAGADDVCVLVYTGGTTGKPKGVVHTHRVHVSMVTTELAEWEWPTDVRFLATTPISHAAGAMIVAVMLRSGTYVMHEGFDPRSFADLVERHRITCAFLVPTMIYVLLDHPATARADYSSMQLVIYGASPMSPARLVEALERFGPVFMQLYGQSEAPNTLTILRRVDHDPQRWPHRLSSCGVPIGESLVKLLDDEGNEVPVGSVGEVCVRGPLVMKEYWNKPDETARALRNGWLYTGDLARRDEDGFLYIVDRSKDMIISGGFNVYPREIEDVLTRHPAVAEAAVIGVPDPKWGEAVKAVVVLREGASAGGEELIEMVRDAKGAVYAPKSVDFVSALPVTGLGKLDKKALRLRYWSGQDRAVH